MTRIGTAGHVVALLSTKLGLVSLILCSLACLDLPARAAIKTWDANGLSPPSGVFNVAANWDVNTTPTNVDSAIFNLAQTYTALFNNSPTNNDLTVSAGNVTFTSSGGARTYSLTDASGGQDMTVTGGTLTLGTSGNPLHLIIGDDLRIRGGAILAGNFGSHISTVDMVLGDSTAPTGNGTLIVDGIGSSLAVTGSAQFGAGGQTGLLVVRNGATADFNGILGLADASTSHFSNGVLSVESGGILTTANIRIGTNATNGQTGTFSVGNAVGASKVTQDANATLVVGATLDGPTPNSGTLSINSGGEFHSGGGIGTITVNGGVLRRDTTGAFNLAAGKTTTIQNGGLFDVTGTYSADTVYTVTGASSNWANSSTIVVGHLGTGSVTISAGGEVSSVGVQVGFAPGSDGTVLVTGAGSAWNNSNELRVGYASTGTLKIEAGGAVSNTIARLGYFGSHAGSGGGVGAVTVSGAGSTWTNSNDLYVGNEGTGSLIVEQGGAVSSAVGYIGFDVSGDGIPSDGAVTVAGASSAWTTASLNVGGSLTQSGGTGSLSVLSGGLVQVNGNAIIWNNGTITVSGSGSALSVDAINIATNGGAPGIGVLTVTGAGASVVQNGLGTLSIGQASLANSATLNVNSGATFNKGFGFTAVNSTGLLSVNSGSFTTSGIVNVNTDGGTGGSGARINVNGAGAAFTQASSSTLTVGHASTGTAAINIGVTASGAVFTTGTALSTIRKTGTVTIGSGVNTGTFNGNGNVTIDGGVLQRNNSGSAFNLASGKTMTVQNGGRASFTGDYNTAASAIYNITGSGSKLETITGQTFIGNDASVNVNSGGLASSQFAINVGTSGNGTLVVDGSNSSASAPFASFWGASGAAANVTFSNNATGMFDGILMALDSTPGTTANVNVVSGADLTVGNLFLVTNGGTTAAAILNVQDSGSTVTQSSETALIVGHATSGTAAINIGTTGSGAMLTTASAGLTTINKTGTITIGGGGNTGTFVANGDVTINGGVLVENLDSAFKLAASRTLTVQSGGRATFSNGDTTANSTIYNVTGPNSKLEVSGGILAPMRINNGAQVNVSSGGLLSSSCFIDVGTSGNGTLLVDGSGSSAFSSVNTNSFWGTNGAIANVTFSNNAIGTFNGGIEFADTTTTGSTAIVNILSGADLNVAGKLLFAESSGAASATLNVQGVGSTVTQSGANVFTVGHATAGSATIHVLNGGAITTGTGIVAIAPTGTILLDATSTRGTFTSNGPMIVSGSVQVGQQVGNAGGTLNINAGLTIDGGTVHLVEGVINANSISLTNGGVFDVDGGTLHVDSFNGNLLNEGGTLAPGHSAGNTTIVGNYTQQAGAALETEIGGLSAGGTYDLVGVTGNAVLDGKLQLALIQNFLPAAADTFTVLNASGIFGVFSNVTTGQRLMTVDGIGSFRVNYGAGSLFNNNQIVLTAFELVALPGDYNHNGTVDAADYIIWRKTDGTPAGYNAWRSHFGRPPGSGSVASANAAVPEPSTVVLFIAGLLTFYTRRHATVS